MPTFPNLVGLSVAAAHTAYTNAGFTGSGYANYGARPYTGLVVGQQPASGTSQPAATNTTLDVASPSGNTVVWGT